MSAADIAIAAVARGRDLEDQSDPATPHRARQLDSYLAALFAYPPTGSFVELRFRTVAGMGRSFCPADELDALAAAITRRALRTDLYIGVLPRRCRGGTRVDLVPEGRVLWIDADTDTAVQALAGFSPSPSIVVLSGTRENCHAYWLLSAPARIDAIEEANRRLALALGADMSSWDAARILRPPGPSLNFKHDPPTVVRLDRCITTPPHRLADILHALPDPPHVGISSVHLPRQAPRITDDPILAVPPVRYIECLLGQRVPRDRKIACPFHAPDRTPSLHVYEDPQRGWYCFGCRRGGSVYDFAAMLSGSSTRGDDFLELRNRLLLVLDVQGA
jgi:hypothetical protein